MSLMVEIVGFEPTTPCLQSRCSPAELYPRARDENTRRDPLLGKSLADKVGPILPNNHNLNLIRPLFEGWQGWLILVRI